MSPRIARAIGYAILFASFPCFFFAFGLTGVAGGSVSMLLLIAGAALLGASTIWCIRKVRCPHCNALLPLKLYDIRTCPYCGRKTD